MRLIAFANAEEQIALFKLITDKVWASLDQQRQAEAARKKAQQAKAALKPRTKRGVSKNFTAPPPPPPKPQPNPNIPAKPKPPTPTQRIDPTASPKPLQPTQQPKGM